jgi:hypothetical protein
MHSSGQNGGVGINMGNGKDSSRSFEGSILMVDRDFGGKSSDVHQRILW